MDVANPFRFQFVRNLKTVHEVDDFSPSVVLASPGFLNSGHSRQLFDRYVHVDTVRMNTCSRGEASCSTGPSK